jgi:hypothetical protein
MALPELPAIQPTRIARLPTVQLFSLLWRIHRTELHPLYFGATGLSRFDPPNTGELAARPVYRVLYAALDFDGAFVETVGHAVGNAESSRAPEIPDVLNVVDRGFLAARSASQLVPRRPLRLADLTGNALQQLGLDMKLLVGDIRVTQALSGAIYEVGFEGILYRSRLDPARQCAAVFDRARGKLHEDPIAIGRLTERPAVYLLREAMRHYGYRWR